MSATQKTKTKADGWFVTRDDMKRIIVSHNNLVRRHNALAVHVEALSRPWYVKLVDAVKAARAGR